MYAGHLPTNEQWLRQLFSAKAATSGGVVRRSRADVERKVGLKALELEVRRRAFHMLEAGDQIIIVCHPGSIRLLV